jgi:short-subunit dehydrogenase
VKEVADGKLLARASLDALERVDREPRLPEASAIALKDRLDQRAVEPSILINHAGFGLNKEFLAEDPERLLAMLQLDIVSLTELTHFLR